MALPGISCGVFASTHSLLHLNSPFRALLKHLYSLEQETKQETLLFVIPEEAQRPFLPLECTICLLFHRNPAPNSEFQIGGAPTEEHPLTSRPGSRDCQGHAQMDALLSAFLEFLPDCSHMDPDSRSFVAPAPSRLGDCRLRCFPEDPQGYLEHNVAPGKQILGTSFSQAPPDWGFEGSLYHKGSSAAGL